MDSSELDLYERELARTVGPRAAHDRRMEMESHLLADVAARMEFGIPEAEANAQAFAALGDLRAAAHEERPSSPNLLIAAAVPGASALMLASWFVPGLTSGAPRRGLTLLMAAWILSAAVGFWRARGKEPGTAIERLLALVPALLTSVLYLPILMPSLPLPPGSTNWLNEVLFFGTIFSAAVLALSAGAVHRRVTWTTGLLCGTAIFVAQTVGVHLMLAQDGAHPSYPLDATLGTWLVFTLPLLLLSGLSAGLANLATRGAARLRSAER